jgi:hypothetical protein
MKRDKKATHVLILGSVFPWEAKAPYTESGHSILGALEYNLETETVKCHECGRWMRTLGNHVKSHDGITAREYRRDRGLNVNTRLYGPDVYRSAPLAETLHKWMRENPTLHKRALEKGRETRARNKRTARRSNRFELGNLNARCKAQLTDRIVQLAIELDRTPTEIELKRAGIMDKTIVSVFGMPYMRALTSIGLDPNKFNRLRLVGKRFGQLTVLEFSHIARRATHWRCRCDCGNETVAKGFHLNSGHTSSCGCLGVIQLAKAGD